MISRLCDLRRLGVFAMGVLAAACSTTGHHHQGTVDRVYVLDGGGHRTNDLSRWSPGVNVGKEWEFSNHCYLIRHAKGLLLWDTGFADAIAALPDGLVLAGGLVRARRSKTLAAQLAEIGVAPADVTHLALSHFHMDHAGNANMFTAATLYIQAAEHDAAFGPTPQQFGFDPGIYDKLRANPTVQLHGDHDVFGDGSVLILATPGHTPGHQSLLVRLPKSGTIILSGDVAHFRENWTYRRVPATNFSREQSLQSMERIASRIATDSAQLWINHDKEQSASVPKAPAYVE